MIRFFLLSRAALPASSRTYNYKNTIGFRTPPDRFTNGESNEYKRLGRKGKAGKEDSVTSAARYSRTAER